MVSSKLMAVFELLLILCTPFGTAVPLRSFYPFGSAAGDMLLGPTNDGSSQAILLPSPFQFFGISFSTLFVNNNGYLTFNQAYNSYIPTAFPIDGNPLIAPFFADVDTRSSGSGKLWYRTTNDSALLAKAVNDIPSILTGVNFSPLWLFIATWDHVGYYDQHTDKTNTFQCILVTDGVQSYAVFQYADGLIQWTTGDDSGGLGGLGGTQAQVGFNAGDSVNYQNVPGSRTPSIINITSTSNVLVPGQWIFEIHSNITTSTVPSPPLNLSLNSVSGSPNQLSAMWSAPNMTLGNITSYTVYCSTSASQAYPEQVVIGPNMPTRKSVINGTTLSTVFSTGLYPYTQYDCYVTASNTFGEGASSSIARGTTGESNPSQPQNVTLTPFSANQLLAVWIQPIPKNGIITAYTVYCNTSATQAYPEQVIGPNVPTVRSVVNGTTLTSVFNTGLNPYTQYECYVIANTSVGEGMASFFVMNRTSESVPSQPLDISLTALPTSPYALYAMWNPPTLKNGIINAYNVYCNTSATQAYPEQVIGPNVPTVRSIVNGTSDSTEFSTGLSPFTNYDCFVTANTSAGEGIASHIITSRTDESIPSPPMNVYLAAIKGSPNQLTATWTPPLPKNGIITAYTVYCNTSANQEYPEQIIGKNIPIIRAVVNGTTQTVGFTTGLIPFTQYDCYVTANTSVGEGVPSQVVINRTSDSVPSQPLNVSLDPIYGSPLELLIIWNPPTLKNGIITAYTVYCNTSATQAYPEQVIGPNVPTVRSLVNGTSHCTAFSTGLSPYTNYDCFVTANTSAGEGIASHIITGRTDESIPGPVVGIKHLCSSFTTITLMWLLPFVPNGIIRHYNITLQSPKVITYTTTQAVTTTLGLFANTAYNFSVAACTAQGCGYPVYFQAATGSIPNITGSVVAINETTLRVSWITLLLPSDGTLVGYTVYYQQSGLNITYIECGELTHVEITNLNINKFYTFTIVGEISIQGQSQNVNSTQQLYFMPINNTAAPAQSSVTIKAVSATLTIIIVLLLILIVVAIVATALIARRKSVIRYVVAQPYNENCYSLIEANLNTEGLVRQNTI